MTDDIHHTLGVAGDTQVCFCGLPPAPLDGHSYGCLIWDWALATRKITAKQRMEQLDQYARELGINPEET